MARRQVVWRKVVERDEPSDDDDGGREVEQRWTKKKNGKTKNPQSCFDSTTSTARCLCNGGWAVCKFCCSAAILILIVFILTSGAVILFGSKR